MHPDLMREVVRQRTTERQEEARKSRLAHALRKTLRQRRRTEAPDTFVTPAIPDYVDGSFRATENAETGENQVTAGRSER
jgi:hypothetical protein